MIFKKRTEPNNLHRSNIPTSRFRRAYSTGCSRHGKYYGRRRTINRIVHAIVEEVSLRRRLQNADMED